MIIFNDTKVFSTFELLSRPDNLRCLEAECVGFVLSSIDLDACLPASPARLRVSQGRTALRSVAHSAMRPHRSVAPRPPVCPSREHVAPRPLRRIALWSVLRRKTIPPLHPSPASGRAVCLLVWANLPTNHTHMSAEAYPPDGPQISPRQGSQNFSARAGSMALDGPVRERAHVSGAARGKLLRPASRRLRRP